MLKQLAVPFRGIRSFEIGLWIALAILVPSLDLFGMWEVDRTESFPDQMLPALARTWVDTAGWTACLWVTIPLGIPKALLIGAINFLGVQTLGINISPGELSLFVVAFDVVVCCVIFCLFRSARYTWRHYVFR